MWLLKRKKNLSEFACRSAERQASFSITWQNYRARPQEFSRSRSEIRLHQPAWEEPSEIIRSLISNMIKLQDKKNSCASRSRLKFLPVFVTQHDFRIRQDFTSFVVWTLLYLTRVARIQICCKCWGNSISLQLCLFFSLPSNCFICFIELYVIRWS